MSCLIPGAIGSWVRAPEPPFDPPYLDPATPYRCEFCRLAWADPQSLKNHRRDKHGAKEPR